MNLTIHSILAFVLAGAIIISCDKELSSINNDDLSSNTSENLSLDTAESSSSEAIQSSNNTESSTNPSNASSSSSSNVPVSSSDDSSSEENLSNNDSSSDLDSSNNEAISSSSDALEQSSNSSQGETTCSEYEQVTCLQEIKPDYNKNEILTNYSGEFNFFEVGFDDIKKYNCQICNDTIKHSKVSITFVNDCEYGNTWCFENRGTTINKSLDAVREDIEVPEGFHPQFYMNFDIWSSYSDPEFTYAKESARINAGTKPRVLFYSITFTDETGQYQQGFTIDKDGMVDGHLWWKETKSSCTLDACYN
ncbi:MAG: hypothetical protein OCC49_01705 [Fibrobacterales bacterium]